MVSKWTKNGLKMDLIWTQNGRKMDQKWTQNEPLTMVACLVIGKEETMFEM